MNTMQSLFSFFFLLALPSPLISMEKEWDGKKYNDNSTPQTHYGIELLNSNQNDINLKDFNYKNKKILDLGCGTGDITAFIAQQCPKSKVTGIDSSESMIKIATEKHAALSNLTFLQKNILETELPSYHYSFIFSSAALLWMKNHELVWKRIDKALNLNCPFILSAARKNPNNLFLQTFNKLVNQPQWVNVIKVENIFDQYNPIDVENTRVILSNLSLTNIKIEEVERKIPFKTSEEFSKWLTGWADAIPAFTQLSLSNKQAFLKNLVEEYVKVAPRDKEKNILYTVSIAVISGYKGNIIGM